jgi:hypothetical protein
MARSDPDKLAQALRANLKRRKAQVAPRPTAPDAAEPPRDPIPAPEKPAQT